MNAQVQMDEQNVAQVTELRQLLDAGLVEVRDQEFVGSLCKQYEKYKNLSPRQWVWVSKMLTKVVAPGLSPLATKQVGNLSGLVAMFQKAKQHLKYPKIFLVVNGKPLELALLGQKSKTPGHISVTDGMPYGQNAYYGKVSPEGELTPGRDLNEMMLLPVVDLLTSMAAQPEETAQKYGKLTGRCCFCNSKLTDEKSTAVGYGPVCADHFGLKWGT